MPTRSPFVYSALDGKVARGGTGVYKLRTAKNAWRLCTSGYDVIEFRQWIAKDGCVTNLEVGLSHELLKLSRERLLIGYRTPPGGSHPAYEVRTYLKEVIPIGAVKLTGQEATSLESASWIHTGTDRFARASRGVLSGRRPRDPHASHGSRMGNPSGAYL